MRNRREARQTYENIRGKSRRSPRESHIFRTRCIGSHITTCLQIGGNLRLRGGRFQPPRYRLRSFRRRRNSSGDSRVSEMFRNARFSDNDLGTRLVSVYLRQSPSLGVAFYLEEEPLIRVTRRNRLLEL